MAQRKKSSFSIFNIFNRGGKGPDADAEKGATPKKTQKGHLVIVPDAHGDPQTLKKALRMVKVPLKRRTASEGGKKIVFLGDAVDRGPDPKGCYQILEDVKAVCLLGNHEWMNLMGVDEEDDPSTPHNEAGFKKYVSAADVASFGGWKQRKAAFSHQQKLGQSIRKKWEVVQLLPAPWGKKNKLPPLESAATLFMHAGITSKLAKSYQNAEDMAEEGREALRKSLRGDNRGFHSKLYLEVLQERFLTRESERKVCADLEKTLAHLGAARLIVGHTPQENNKALIRCGGRFICLDVAMSRWMSARPSRKLGDPAVLELKYEGQQGEEMLTALDIVYPTGVEPVAPFDGELPEL